MPQNPLILVLGDDGWPPIRGATVLCRRPVAEWSLRARPGRLETLAHDGTWLDVSGVVWCSQFDLEPQLERSALETIRQSGVPCLNSAEACLDNGSRMASHHRLREAGLPVLPMVAFFGNAALASHKPHFPSVLKVGGHHMGYGKAKIGTREAWNDAVDMAALSRDFAILEPYVDYTVDLRITILCGEMHALRRKPSQWKANVCPTSVKLVPVPAALRQPSLLAAESLGAEIVGLDWLRNSAGEWFLLEANLAPGLVFPGKDLRDVVARRLLSRLSGARPRGRKYLK